MVILKLMFADPPELFAYIVNKVVDRLTLGAPEITPPVMTNPVGKAGVISQVATFPPVLLVEKLVMLTPLVNTLSVIEERIATGSFTVILKVILAVPPELLAQIVNDVVVRFTEGVPVITPPLKVNPFGRAGEISHVATNPPEFVVWIEEIDWFLVYV